MVVHDSAVSTVAGFDSFVKLDFLVVFCCVCVCTLCLFGDVDGVVLGCVVPEQVQRFEVDV